MSGESGRTEAAFAANEALWDAWTKVHSTGEPLTFEVKGSYADPDADVGEHTEHGWDHGLGEIVTALIDAGLRIEALVEHPFVEWKVDFLVEDGQGRWRLPPDAGGELPLMFSLRATKPG